MEKEQLTADEEMARELQVHALILLMQLHKKEKQCNCVCSSQEYLGIWKQVLNFLNGFISQRTELFCQIVDLVVEQ